MYCNVVFTGMFNNLGWICRVGKSGNNRPQSKYCLVHSLNSIFRAPFIGVEPRRKKIQILRGIKKKKGNGLGNKVAKMIKKTSCFGQ